MPRKKPSRPALRWGDGYINRRTLNDGTLRYQAHWSETDPSRGTVWRARTFPSQEEAETHLRRIGEAKRTDRYVAESQLRIQDAVQEYISRQEAFRRWKASTVATNTVLARRMMTPRIGDLRVSRVTHHQLQLWVDGLLREGKSVSATANVLSLVRASLTDLVRLGVIPANPAQGVSVGRRQPTQRTTWTHDEVRQVLATAAADSRLHALYILALTTGMRPGELRALRWSDIDLAAGRLRCARTITSDVDQHQVMGDSPKTGRTRIIVLTEPVLAALKTWRREQTTRRLAHPAWHDDDIVFDRGDGAFTANSTWQKQHRELVRAAGVRHLSPHGMRHTAATLMLEQDIHPKVVSEILGHASITMTLDLYSHVSADLQKAAAERMARQLLHDVSSTTTSDDESPDPEQTHA